MLEDQAALKEQIKSIEEEIRGLGEGAISDRLNLKAEAEELKEAYEAAGKELTKLLAEADKRGGGTRLEAAQQVLTLAEDKRLKR